MYGIGVGTLSGLIVGAVLGIVPLLLGVRYKHIGVGFSGWC